MQPNEILKASRSRAALLRVNVKSCIYLAMVATDKIECGTAKNDSQVRALDKGWPDVEVTGEVSLTDSIQ